MSPNEFLSAVLDIGSIDLVPAKGVDMFKCKLTVVDESHNIFRPDQPQGKLAQVDSGYKLLLSDESQSSAISDTFPAMQRVKLTEVIRSTKRIVAGASAFQVTAEHVTSQGTDGPPLKTFLFEAASSQQRLTEQYCQHVADAFVHLANAFPGVKWHKRVAVLLPNIDFLERLGPLLQPALHQKFPHRHLRFIRFVDSLRSLPGCLFGSGASRTEGPEEIVLDIVDVADGLEQLIVICVGLDAAIREDVGDLAVRAQLYKGVTRAQLLAIVVNEHVRDGWLEFLSNVEFSGRGELSKMEASPPPCQAAFRICHEAKQSAQPWPSAKFEAKSQHTVKDPAAAQISLGSEATAEATAAHGSPVPRSSEHVAKGAEHKSSLWDTSSNNISAPSKKPKFDPVAEQKRAAAAMLDAEDIALLYLRIATLHE